MSANAALGQYPNYVEAADILGAARFAVPSSVWRNWTPVQRWSENRRFLDESLRRGRFILTTPPSLARPGSMFLREIGHLHRQGYPTEPTYRLDLI